MMRYLRLYKSFLRFSFLRNVEFRVDFFFRIFMDIIFYAVNIYFFKVIFLHTHSLGGWGEDQILLFVSVFLLIDAFYMTFVQDNVWMIPLMINKGDLDFYLLRPVSTLFFISLRQIAVNSFLNLVIALGIFVYAVTHYQGEFTTASILLFMLAAPIGFCLYHYMRLLFILPVFWIHSGRGLELVFWVLARLMERPEGIFYGIIRIVFVFVVPFLAISSFPAKVLMGEDSLYHFTALFLIWLVFTGLVALVWKKALRAYSSASS